MKLKTSISKAELDALPNSLAVHYTPKGKTRFVLDVEAADGLELADVGALKSEEKRLLGALEKRLVEDEITSAVASLGGNVALLRPIISARARLNQSTLKVDVTGDGGRPYVNLRGEDGSIEDLVADLKKNPAYTRAFDAPEPVQIDTAAKPPRPEWGDAKTLTEFMATMKVRRDAQLRPKVDDVKGNPWRRESWNFTHQVRIAQADPSRAAMLRAEAERAGR